MADPIYRFISCTDRSRPHDLARPPGVALRIAQLTDPHVPGETSLMARLRDLASPHRHLGAASHHLSAIVNELSHNFRKPAQRTIYLGLIEKALLGLRRLQVDHLVITGDLSHCGLAAEFVDMRAALEVTGWLEDDKLTVIAGNHDRFNLYEQLPSEPMERFFDVIDHRNPRLKELPGGVVLVEIDSNRDPADDRHPTERWLPNVVGHVYPEVLDWLPRQAARVAGRRLVVLIHHHMSSDWYHEKVGEHGWFGLMAPLPERHELIEAARMLDEQAIFLHGHRHDIMPIDYRFEGHRLGNPGGFASSLRVNILDFDAQGHETLIQAELRE